MAGCPRSICSRCNEQRKSVEQDWYRVAKSGRGGNPGMGAYLGTVAQLCDRCWHELLQNDELIEGWNSPATAPLGGEGWRRS